MKRQEKAIVSLIFWCLVSLHIFYGVALAAEIGSPSIWGFADLHNHQFSNLGFGGKMFLGAPFSDTPGGMADALQNCQIPLYRYPNGAFDSGLFGPHGLGGTSDLIEIAEGEGPIQNGGGWPDFNGWPRWNTVTH